MRLSPKEYLQTIAVMLLLTISACNSKSKQPDLIIDDNQPTVELSKSDTATVPALEESHKTEEKQSVPVCLSSSSHSHKSCSDDNLRGFDPAFEDDMDDNGMNRYMENNDEDGWD